MPDNSPSEVDATLTLLDSRTAVYGDRIQNMVRVAQIWSGLLGFTVQPVQVPIMMAAYKQYRMSITPDYSDNVDDVDGWMKMAREVVGNDMIHARTVEEYLEKKDERDRASFEREYGRSMGGSQFKAAA